VGWVNYLDFRMGVLDQGTRLQPEIALRSAASASDVLIDTRGGVVRRPGFEDQGVDLDNEFVTIPYFTEEETYLFVITYGDNILEWHDGVVGSDSGAADQEIPDTGDQTWTVGTPTPPLTGHTQFTGKIYLYKVSQTDAETGATDVGFVTQQHWATTKSDYLFGPQLTIRRGQTTVAGYVVPDLTYYLHPWTRSQCHGMQYAQHGSRLYLFTTGFPTIEIQKSDRAHELINATHTKMTSPHASKDVETASTESERAVLAPGASLSSSGAWNLEVDALEPEVARRASPPINLFLSSTTELAASDDFFTKEMEGGFISYGSTKINTVNAATQGDWLATGVIVRILNVKHSRLAKVGGIHTDGFLDLVAGTMTTGADIYDTKTVSQPPGNISTLTSNMLGDWAGPWVEVVKPTQHPEALTGMTAVPESFVDGVAGSPHFCWGTKTNYSTTERDNQNIGYPNEIPYYYCDSDSDLGVQLVSRLSLNENDVGSIVQVHDLVGTDEYVLYYLYNVSDTSGGYDFSGTLRFHFMQEGSHETGGTTGTWGNFARFDEVAIPATITVGTDSWFSLYKVKPPFIMMGCMGWDSDPATLRGQNSKATVFVNDPQFLPANLHTPNRGIKSGGVTRGFEVSTVTGRTSETVVDENLEAPLVGGTSIFFRNGVFRPTARVSEVCYEGYWETLPTVPTPQNFVSFGTGGSTGFATCGTQHQGRLVIGGFGGAFEDAVVFSTTAQPRRMMSPNIDSAEDAFSIQLGQSTEEQVNWFGSTQVGLVVGGKTGEYLIRGEPISANKIAFQRISSVGGANIRAVYTDSEIVFVCRDKRALGGVQIQEGADQTTFSLRLSDRASSLFTNEILQSGYIYSPYPIFFYLMDNGTMLTFTRDQSVGGFTTMSHAHGTIKSLSSAVRSSKISDTLFACVQRTIGGAIKHRLERLNFTALLDSQRCTNQYTVASYGGESDIEVITTTKVSFLNSWAGQTLHVVTVDSSGNKIYRGTLDVEARTMADGSTIEYSIDLTGLGLTTVPTKVITGFNFDGVFEPSSVTEMPGYICSYTSGIMLGENVTGLTINKGDIVPVKTNEAHLSSSGWINVYNLGHFSRDAGPEFTLKGPFSSTVQSLSIEVESKE